MAKTAEDKAKEICHNYRNATILGYPMADESIAFNAAMDMAKWCEEHPKEGLVDIEKVCDCLRNFQNQRGDYLTEIEINNIREILENR